MYKYIQSEKYNKNKWEWAKMWPVIIIGRPKSPLDFTHIYQILPNDSDILLILEDMDS